MCRLSAITSGDYFSPMENILALETMKEGHDGSGLGNSLGVTSRYLTRTSMIEEEMSKVEK